MRRSTRLRAPDEAGLADNHMRLNVSDVELHEQLWVDHLGGVVTQIGSLIAVRLPGSLPAPSGHEPTGGPLGSGTHYFSFKIRTIGDVPDRVPHRRLRSR